jgi:hypothetical protein
VLLPQVRISAESGGCRLVLAGRIPRNDLLSDVSDEQREARPRRSTRLSGCCAGRPIPRYLPGPIGFPTLDRRKHRGWDGGHGQP